MTAQVQHLWKETEFHLSPFLKNEKDNAEM